MAPGQRNPKTPGGTLNKGSLKEVGFRVYLEDPGRVVGDYTSLKRPPPPPTPLRVPMDMEDHGT